MAESVELAGVKGPRLAAILAWISKSRRPNHRPDAAAVGEIFGVTAQTVRRWIRAGLPVSHASEVAAMIAVPEDQLRMQRDQVEQAREMAKEMHTVGAGVLQSWADQGWMEPHRLEVVELTERDHLQLARFTRVSSDGNKKGRPPGKYGARVVDSVVFPNRLVARVAKGELLEAVREWRVYAPKSYVERGGTEVWLEGAPRPKLSTLKRSMSARKIGRHRAA